MQLYTEKKKKLQFLLSTFDVDS